MELLRIDHLHVKLISRLGDSITEVYNNMV